MQANEITVDLDPTVNDLGPLAWVLDELRKSLDGAVKALRRFVRDADMALGSDLASLDTSHLRIARQQLHQAQGALEMVGLGGAAGVLRAMESVAQRFVQRPELCTHDEAQKVEQASFALIEYLEALLRSRQVSPVVLFPQYRDLQQIVGEERIHPADLSLTPWRWVDLAVDESVVPVAFDDSSRTRFDQAMLKVIKSGHAGAADKLRVLCLGFAAAQQGARQRSFWTIGAAYFEAIAHGWCANDVYVKRTSSRVLTQYIALQRGDMHLTERLAQDLMFFCERALPQVNGPAPTLLRVASAYGLHKAAKSVDYEARLFGRYDPALLIQARKRISVAKESWAALSGGDVQKLKAATDQFGLVSESLVRLDPNNHLLAEALTRAMDATQRSGHPPSPQLALEVATSVLFLEAAYDEIDPEDTQLAKRSERLALRLDQVLKGGAPQPLETWMEDLYRRVSERQTMGSVVGELGVTMSQLEKSMDQFFRDPTDKSVLQSVPGQLSQTRGVLSLLGLEQASMAVLHMRDNVEQILISQSSADPAMSAATFDLLGNSMGALGFMVDMLSYQPTLAKKMFVFDQDKGEFKSVMGRSQRGESPAGAVPMASADVPATGTAEFSATPQAEPDVAAPPQGAPAPAVTPSSRVEEDQELREIFIDEARDVLKTGLETVDVLAAMPDDIAQQTTLRRSFHTLKGSARMVGLDQFGEAGWALEQLLNSWIAEQQPVTDELRGVAFEALHGLQAWLDSIATRSDSQWKAAPFRAMADALRLDGRRMHLQRPDGIENPVQLAPQDRPVEEIKLDLSDVPLTPPYTASGFAALSDERTAELSRPLEFTDIDFGEWGDVQPKTQTAVMSEHVDLDMDLLDSELGRLTDEQVKADASLSPVAQQVAAVEVVDFDLGGLENTAPELQALAQAVAEPVVESVELEEDVKVIGDLRIGIPLYNVYLNEADEWSRRLVTELAEWAMELPKQVADSTIALAHSLAGSSATVGFKELSLVARDLEHALEHVRLQGRGNADHGELFSDAAQDIRRLLHQFAAGFIKEADPTIVRSLKSLCDTEVIEFAESGGSTGAQPLVSEWAEPVAIDTERVAQETPPIPSTPAVVTEASAPSVPHSEALASAALLTPVLAAHDPGADEIDVQDAIDVDLFPIFEEEALVLLPGLAGALRQWAARPENLGARAEVLRTLHTLKGSARLAGAMRLGEMAHRLESAVESLGSEGLQSSQVEPLLNRFDDLQSNFDALRRADAAANEDAVVHPHEIAQAVMGTVLSAAAPAVVLAKPDRATASSVGVPLPLVRTTALQSVRVRPQLLDRLVNQAGEVMMTRSRLEAGLSQLGGSLGELTGNLDRLRHQLRDIELQAETQMQSRLAQSKDSAAGFDPLEFDRFTRVQELTRMMAESVNDVATVQRNLQRAVESTEDSLVAQARQTRELQRDLLRTRMVEFENIAERLYGVVRQASKDAGKQVRLDIVGGSIELDRSVLDRMTPAFEHLLRNCVGHGIETPAVRTAAGKDSTGTITVILGQEGNDVAVEFVDDGAGLNLPRIKDKAVGLGMMVATDELTVQRAADLIFAPGFSTAEQVTELAGRGIGMDVVRAEISALGGRIETDSQTGKGTRFKLVLPLTTAVTQVVIVRAGNLTVGVPANLVETVRRVKSPQLMQAYQEGQFDDGVMPLPFFWAGALLQASSHSKELDSKTLSVVIFRSAGQRVAVHVDEVLGNQEVVVKNLGTQLARLPGLAAMTVLASGAVVLIYNPVALATVYGDQARVLGSQERVTVEPFAKRGPTVGADGVMRADTDAQQRLPLVLVVDDSITVRRVTQRLLLREGYRVSLAVDGLQALERLQEELPAVVLTDIEMPRMDGFDLARNIRGDVHMKNIPIIMITSRIADKHREHATELGVNHYLGKPYPEDELLSLVRGYCTSAVTV